MCPDGETLIRMSGRWAASPIDVSWRAFWRGADALVHGCEAETFCFAAAEAAASGLQLIVPDRGGASDIGRQNAGLLYTAADTADLKRQILTFADKRGSVRSPNPSTSRTIEDHFRQLFKDYEALTRIERAMIG